MQTIEKDITTVTHGIIFHQVNCKGTMGAGVARALADKFVGLEPAYQEFIGEYLWDHPGKRSSDLLGNVFLFQITDELFVCNVFGQDNFSRNGRQTSYDATVDAFEAILDDVCDNKENSIYHGKDLYFPFQIGCGLGGGRWDLYSSIIQSYFGDRAIICKLPQKKGEAL